MKSRNAKTDRLFWRPEDEFTRFNEWCEPKVFSFGDMDILEEKNLRKIAENYLRCGDVLLEQVLKNELQDYVAQFPIIYLFRHSVEVLLKHIIIAQNGKIITDEHNLHRLMNFAVGIDPWAQRRIQEIGAIDPSSESLRYGGVGERAPAFIGTELHFFREAMLALHRHLCEVADAAGRMEAL